MSTPKQPYFIIRTMVPMEVCNHLGFQIIVPSFAVRFKRFESFDLRLHRHVGLDAEPLWRISEGKTGLCIAKGEERVESPTADGACEAFMRFVKNHSITPQRMAARVRKCMKDAAKEKKQSSRRRPKRAVSRRKVA